MENKRGFIEKLYLAALFPNIIAILGGTVNVFFDSVFVGNKLGEAGLESVNQCLPVYLILCTAGSLFASGAFIRSSIAMGMSDKKTAERVFRAALIAAAAAGVIICVLGYVFSEAIGGKLSNALTKDYVVSYLKITFIGGAFKVIMYIPYFYLKLDGKDRQSAAAMLTMTFLNILLDWLFLFVFDLGIEGAAWASTAATFIACVMSFIFLFTGKHNFSFGFDVMSAAEWKDVIRFGSPMALNNVLSAARILVINLVLNSMDIAGIPAVFAVINNINEFSICVQNGVPQTGSAMTGIFFGEKDSDSVKKTLNTELMAGAALSAGFGTVLLLFSRDLGALFGISADCTIASVCFAVYLLFATFNSTMSYYFNAVGQIRMSNLITVCRGFVFMAVFCVIFSSYGGMVWLFLPAAEIASLAIFLAAGTVKAKKMKLTPFYLIDESLERSGRSISFTVECDNGKICEASDRIREFCEQNELPPKKTMAISLSIEEILTVISQKSLGGKGEMSVRVLRYDEQSGERAIVRIRSAGKLYNPFEERDEDTDYMGVDMINRLADRIEYRSALGVNTLLIFI